MTPIDLSKFAGASKGPWTVHDSGLVDVQGRIVAKILTHNYPDPTQANIDAALIASAPALVDEVRRLRGEVDRITKLHNALATTSSLRTEQLEAHRDKLAGALGEYVHLDTKRRAGEQMGKLAWADCYSTAQAALADAGGGKSG